jgi:hypothetical protein
MSRIDTQSGAGQFAHEDFFHAAPIDEAGQRIGAGLLLSALEFGADLDELLLGFGQLLLRPIHGILQRKRRHRQRLKNRTHAVAAVEGGGLTHEPVDLFAEAPEAARKFGRCLAHHLDDAPKHRFHFQTPHSRPFRGRRQAGCAAILVGEILRRGGQAELGHFSERVARDIDGLQPDALRGGHDTVS